MWDNLIFGTTKRKINKTILNDGEISLEVNWISQQEYGFNIILLSTKEQVGQCDLRTKHNESMFYYGNIGYRVYPKYRGHSYALKACKLLLNLARTLKVEYLILTVSPDNVASVSTIEKLGCKYIETVDVPVWHPLHKRGETVKLIYRLDLN